MSVQNKIQLITYVDRFSGGNLLTLHTLLKSSFADLFGGIHLLPFYERIDGEDAGFDPIDHCEVDKRLGDWNDIQQLSEDYELMADLIINHMSCDSTQFQDYIAKGSNSKYAGMFLRYKDVFPNGATEEELLNIYRPRPGLPFARKKVAGKRDELFWATFTPKQIDINIFHRESKNYIDGIIRRFKNSGINIIRLDAAGYAVKNAGSNSFMTEETFEYISEFSEKAKAANIEVLVEIHSHYLQQIEISKRVDKVYDFALPPLVLHTLYNNSTVALKNWLEISPHNCITILDTHDGIGIVDVASEAAKAGLLNNDEIESLVEGIHERSNGESRKSTGNVANNLDIYQINCTFYSALAKNDNDYLLARLIQFICPGIPQVYYVGLLAGANDMNLLEQTKVGRDVNRHYYSPLEIQNEIQRDVVKQLFSLIRFRNNHPAFQGEFTLLDSLDDCLAISWKAENAELFTNVFLSNRTFSMVSTINSMEQKFNEWDELKKFKLFEAVNLSALN